MWSFLCFLCEACSGFFAVPIMTYLLKIFKCRDVDGAAYLAATLGDDDDDFEVDDVWEDDDDAASEDGGVVSFDVSFGLAGDTEAISCWDSKHSIYTAISVFMIFLYLPMAIR